MGPVPAQEFLGRRELGGQLRRVWISGKTQGNRSQSVTAGLLGDKEKTSCQQISQ